MSLVATNDLKGPSPQLICVLLILVSNSSSMTEITSTYSCEKPSKITSTYS